MKLGWLSDWEEGAGGAPPVSLDAARHSHPSQTALSSNQPAPAPIRTPGGDGRGQ